MNTAVHCAAESPNSTTIPEIVLPNEAYTSQDYFERELVQIWYSSWVFAGIASSVPDPGDILPVEVPGAALLLIRQHDGTLAAVHNVCAHRGCPLLNVPKKHARQITCPYHAWAYDLDGSLKLRPYYGQGGQHERLSPPSKELGLKPVALQQFGDLIFINVDGKAGSFEDYIRPMLDLTSRYDLSALRRSDYVARFDIQANWKLVSENWLDALHIFSLHPRLVAVTSQTTRSRNEYEGNMFFGSYKIETEANELAVKMPLIPVTNDQDSLEVHTFYVFPNAFIQVRPQQLVAFRVTPHGPNRTLEDVYFYFVGDSAHDIALEPVRRSIYEAWTSINEEDIPPVEGMQIGRRSPAFTGGKWSEYWDRALAGLCKLVDNRMKTT